MIGIFILNSIEKDVVGTFIMAFVMGLYDGALVMYIWTIITTEFKDRFLAFALVSSVFMVFNFIIVMTNSVLTFDQGSVAKNQFSYMIYFIFQTVVGLVNLVVFAYAFKFESLKPSEQIIVNAVRRASFKATGREIAGLKEITDEDVLNKERKEAAKIA